MSDSRIEALGQLTQRSVRQAIRSVDLRELAREMRLGMSTIAYAALGRRVRPRTRTAILAWLSEQSERASQ